MIYRAHEWGHAYGLRDLPAVNCNATKNGLMHGGAWAYDNCGWIGPVQDDHNGVNFYA
jgi:hypothetical protein